MTFSPGRLGMKLKDNVVIHVSPDSTSELSGVQEGWGILYIDGLPYTHDLLIKHATGEYEYDVIFQVYHFTSLFPSF